MNGRLFIGVDAGGTKTRAVLAGADGSLLGVGEAGAGNPQAIGYAAAGAAWSEAVRWALAASGVEMEEAGRGGLTEAFFGVAGVRTDGERALAAGELTGLGLAGKIVVGSDLEIAHAGALGGGAGVVVIAGTGSAAWGRNTEGATWQAGGWGWLVDDAGGGYWLALRGLAAACEAEDGRGPATGLGKRALAYFAAPGLRDVLRLLHGGGRDRAAVAGFAREICEAARTGDAVAAELLEEGGEALVRLAEAVRAKIAPEAVRGGFPLAVTGGLGMGERIEARAKAAGFAPVMSWGEPVLGAVLRAAEAAGARLDGAAKTRLLTEWNNRV